MSHLNHLGNQYSYNQGYADAREQAAQRLHDEIEALRLSVECPNLSDAMHAVVNNVLRGACQPGGIIHPELDDKRRAFIDSLADDTAPPQYESLSLEAALKMGMERYGTAMKKLADKGDN